MSERIDRFGFVLFLQKPFPLVLQIPDLAVDVSGLRVIILGREQLFVVEPRQHQILRGEVGDFPIQRLKAFRFIRCDHLQGFQLID